MTLGMIGLGYAGVGVLATIVIAIMRGAPTPGDAVLTIVMWPLWGPLSLVRDPKDHREQELLGALARAQASPLASVLPDAESARVLAARLREASVRLGELDEVLARPDFDPAAAQRRAKDLEARGATTAAATAELRVRTLGQLRTLRERYRSELEEVHELIAQLVTQAELVRLQPSAAHASSELVRELVSRVEGLSDLFAYQATLEASPGEYVDPLGRSTS
ncbi:MAG: hypothetical protein H0V17_33930 [Deltaproteobacteria bacterium]|nr:hypothetical protein [Deltaproteobacteria bacterium]